jgi:hypothetical protein
MAKNTGMAFGTPKRDTAALSNWVAAAPADNEIAALPPVQAAEPVAVQKAVKALPVKAEAVIAAPTETARMVIDIDREMHKRLRRRCLDEGETMADVVRRLVGDYVGR